MGAYADCPNYKTCGNQMWIGENSTGQCGDCDQDDTDQNKR